MKLFSSRSMRNVIAVIGGLFALLAVGGESPAGAADAIEVVRQEGNRSPQQPQLAVDKRGVVHLVYGVGDSVRYQRSDDGGKTFDKSVEIRSRA